MGCQHKSPLPQIFRRTLSDLQHIQNVSGLEGWPYTATDWLCPVRQHGADDKSELRSDFRQAMR